MLTFFIQKMNVKDELEAIIVFKNLIIQAEKI